MNLNFFFWNIDPFSRSFIEPFIFMHSLPNPVLDAKALSSSHIVLGTTIYPDLFAMARDCSSRTNY